MIRGNNDTVLVKITANIKQTETSNPATVVLVGRLSETMRISLLIFSFVAWYIYRALLICFLPLHCMVSVLRTNIKHSQSVDNGRGSLTFAIVNNWIRQKMVWCLMKRGAGQCLGVLTVILSILALITLSLLEVKVRLVRAAWYNTGHTRHLVTLLGPGTTPDISPVSCRWDGSFLM